MDNYRDRMHDIHLLKVYLNKLDDVMTLIRNRLDSMEESVMDEHDESTRGQILGMIIPGIHEKRKK